MNAPGQPELERRLAARPAPEPPPDLLAKLKAEIPAALPAPRTVASRRSRPMPWQWLAAASLLVAVGGAFLSLRVLRESPQPTAPDRQAARLEPPSVASSAPDDEGRGPEATGAAREESALQPPPPRRARMVPKPKLVAPPSEAVPGSEAEPVQPPDLDVLFDEVAASDASVSAEAESKRSSGAGSLSTGAVPPSIAAAPPAAAKVAPDAAAERGRAGVESELRKQIQQPVAVPEHVPAAIDAFETVAVIGKAVAAKHPLVGVTVTASAPDRDDLFTTHTNQNGEFSLIGLRPGASYELRFELEGFEPATRELRLEDERRVEVGTVEMEPSEVRR